MDSINVYSEFNFNGYQWPPTQVISSGRFITNGQHIADGGCRSTYLGKDTETEQPIVIKKFKHTCNQAKVEQYFTEDVDASRMAQELAKLYNKEVYGSKTIYFILPLIHRCEDVLGHPFHANERVLIEPYLGQNYNKFNTNWGYEDTRFGLSMPTLSHFTYHVSGGNLLLCDLQGVKKDDQYILTDPVICSLGHTYGITDLGERGIRSFFAYHRCTNLCDSSWLKHPHPVKYDESGCGTEFQW